MSRSNKLSRLPGSPQYTAVRHLDNYNSQSIINHECLKWTHFDTSILFKVDVYDLRPEKTCAVILMSFDLVICIDEFHLYLYSALGKG